MAYNQKFMKQKNRCLISISGDDRKTFLQGFITNDINKVSNTQAIYSLMLSPAGRFLYDFFIISDDEKLLLECDREKVDEIVQKFSFYKLRSKVEIKKEEDLLVVAAFDHLVDQKICFSDSRNSQMGFRAYLNSKDLKGLASGDIGNEDQYNMKRINLKLPDDSDLSYDKSFPLEFGFDDLNAIDYKKGCYVGQETTARMHYKGIIRKKIFLVKILNCQKINKGLEIESEDKKIGEILSSVFYQNQLFALALIKNLDNEGQEIDLTNLKLTADGKELEIK